MAAGDGAGDGDVDGAAEGTTDGSVVIAGRTEGEGDGIAARMALAHGGSGLVGTPRWSAARLEAA